MIKLIIIPILLLSILELPTLTFALTLSLGGTGSKQIEKHVVIKITKPILFTTPPTTTTLSPMSTTTTVPAPITTPVTTVPIRTPNSTLETGIGCGIKQLKSFEIVRIQSNNFGFGNYPNQDACTWKFVSNDCTISASCPCFDVPASFDCLGDYLKILDLPHYHQKFCGSTVPNGIYRASTDLFSLRFRSDKRNSGRGFVCFVQCTPPGYADQMPPPVTCPIEICNRHTSKNEEDILRISYDASANMFGALEQNGEHQLATKKTGDSSLIVLYNPNDYLKPIQTPQAEISQGNNVTTKLQLPLPPTELSSTTLLIPPPKKARLREPGESECKIIEYVVPEDSSEIQAPLEYVKSFESQDSTQIRCGTSHFVFPSTTGTNICPFPLNQDTHFHKDSAPLYSVSGTQRLIEFDEPFNLKLEFPIPRYFHPYKSQKWWKRGTSLTTMEKAVKPKSLSIISKGKSATLTRRVFKSPIYKLSHIPLRLESRYRLPVYLSEDVNYSEMEIKLKEMDEILRGHPPTKKIKLDILNVISTEVIQNNFNNEQESRIDFNNGLDMNLKDHSKSFNFLFKDKRLKKNVTFLDGSTSETDDEMKTIENDHPDMTDWKHSGFETGIPEDNNVKGLYSPVVRSMERRSMDRIKDALKFGMMLPLRFFQSSAAKVLPESAEQKMGKHMLEESERKQKSLKSKNIFSSFQSFGNTTNHNKSSGSLSLPQAQESRIGFTIRNRYRQFNIKANEDEILQDGIYSNNLNHHKTLHNKEVSHPEGRTETKSLPPNDSLENQNIEINTNQPLIKIGKGSNENTNASEVHKTRSPSILKSLVGLFRKSQEKQDLNDLEAISVTLPVNIQPGENSVITDEKVDQREQIIPISPTIALQQPITTSVVHKKDIITSKNIDKNSNGPKKVSFLQTIFGFFHRKDDVIKITTKAIESHQNDQQEKNKDETKRKTFLEKIGIIKTRKPDAEIVKKILKKDSPTEVLEIGTDDQEATFKLPNHTNSVSIMRKKRLKLFEETREFYEDSIMAYRNVLSQAVGSQIPLEASTITPSIVNPFVRLESTNIMLQKESSLGYKCTVSESVIMPAMSRRKRRLNQSFFSPEDQSNDLVINEPANTNELNLANPSSDNQPLKGILKNIPATILK